MWHIFSLLAPIWFLDTLTRQSAGATSPSRNWPRWRRSGEIPAEPRAIISSQPMLGTSMTGNPSRKNAAMRSPARLLCAAVVVWVGKTELRYQLRAIEDLHKMLKTKDEWTPLGSADEQKPAEKGTVEGWARAPDNPVGGWYGIKKGLRGRFANYIPPILEALELAEVEHNPRNNRMQAL